jgi:hypothetical protein
MTEIKYYLIELFSEPKYLFLNIFGILLCIIVARIRSYYLYKENIFEQRKNIFEEERFIVNCIFCIVFLLLYFMWPEKIILK